jgi:hypothetical protein
MCIRLGVGSPVNPPTTKKVSIKKTSASTGKKKRNRGASEGKREKGRGREGGREVAGRDGEREGWREKCLFFMKLREVIMCKNRP